MSSDLEKLDSFTLEMSKNHLIRNFLRNGRVRVNEKQRKLSFIFFSNIKIMKDVWKSLKTGQIY